MNILRRFIFVVLFTIICVLFALGFLKYPLINLSNIFFNADLYSDKINITLNPTHIGTLKDISESVNDSYKKYSENLYTLGIITTSLIGGGILFSILYLKSFSKLLFILAQFCMFIFIVIIAIFKYTTFITDIIPFPDLPKGIKVPKEYKDISSSFGTGSIFIIISIISMVIINVLYSFLG
jgi:hypothetical protein